MYNLWLFLCANFDFTPEGILKYDAVYFGILAQCHAKSKWTHLFSGAKLLHERVYLRQKEKRTFLKFYNVALSQDYDLKTFFLIKCIEDAWIGFWNIFYLKCRLPKSRNYFYTEDYFRFTTVRISFFDCLIVSSSVTSLLICTCPWDNICCSVELVTLAILC